MAPIDDMDEPPLAGTAVNADDKPEVIVKLEKLDDQYLEVDREFQKELDKLRAKYKAQQKPLLTKRAQMLAAEVADGSKTGTPSLNGFWLQALTNHPDLQDDIEKWDGPVLEYLRDILASPLDEDNTYCGFRLAFHFAPNPYFENAVLSKEYHTRHDPYKDMLETIETRGCKINWKAGKNVTLEKAKVGKKTKGKSSKSEPRESFFRMFFRDLKSGGHLPEDIDIQELDMRLGSGGDLDEDDLMESLLDLHYDMGKSIMDEIVPYAVRWYTGEACPDQQDSDDDDGSDEEDSDESEDEM